MERQGTRYCILDASDTSFGCSDQESEVQDVLDAATAYRAMTTIGMAVESYRQGRVLYFNEVTEKVTDKPVPLPTQTARS